MMIKILGYALVVMTLWLAPSHLEAQDGLPITAENAAELTHLYDIGGIQPGELAWSSDGTRLAVGTSAGVHLLSIQDVNNISLVIESAGADVAFNGSGDLLISGGQIWDAVTGAALLTLGDYQQRILSPTGNKLITVHTENAQTVMRLWDVQSPQTVAQIGTLETGMGQDYYLKQGIFSPDESYFVGAFEGFEPLFAPIPAMTQVWSLVDSPTLKITYPYDYPVIEQLLFGGDGHYLIVANQDSNLYGNPTGDVWIYWLDDGSLFNKYSQLFVPVVSSDDQWVMFWDLAYAAKAVRLQDPLGSIPLDTDISDIAAILGNPLPQFGVEAPYEYSGVDPRLLFEITLPQRPSALARDAAFYPHLASGQIAYWLDDNVWLQPSPTDAPISIFQIDGYSGRLLDVYPAANLAAFIGTELQLRDLATNEVVYRQPVQTGQGIEVKFSQDGTAFMVMELSIPGNPKNLAVPIPQIDLSIRQTSSPEIELSHIQVTNTLPPRIGFSADGSLLAVLTSNTDPTSQDVEQIYDTATGKRVAEWQIPGRLAHALSADGQFLAVTTMPNVDLQQIEVWDLSRLPEQAPQVAAALITQREAFRLAFTPDRQYLIAEVFNGEAMMVGGFALYILPAESLFAAAEGTSMDDLPGKVVNWGAQSYTFTADHTLMLVVQGALGETKPYQLTTLPSGEVIAELSGTGAAVFSPDGKLLATAKSDAVQLWEVSTLMQPIAEGESRQPLVNLAQADVTGLAFSPTGDTLYLSTVNHVAVWGLQ